MLFLVYLTVGFLYGAGAETLIFVTGTSGKYPKLFGSRQKKQSQLWIPRNPRKNRCFGYPVLRSKPQRWIPELRFGYPPLRKFPKSFWEKLRIFLESLGGSQRQLCIKIRPLLLVFSCPNFRAGKWVHFSVGKCLFRWEKPFFCAVCSRGVKNHEWYFVFGWPYEMHTMQSSQIYMSPFYFQEIIF